MCLNVCVLVWSHVHVSLIDIVFSVSSGYSWFWLELSYKVAFHLFIFANFILEVPYWPLLTVSEKGKNKLEIKDRKGLLKNFHKIVHYSTLLYTIFSLVLSDIIVMLKNLAMTSSAPDAWMVSLYTRHFQC